MIQYIRKVLAALLYDAEEEKRAIQHLTHLVHLLIQLQLGASNMDLTELTAQVTSTEGVEASGVVLIGALAAELLKQAGDPAAVHDLATRLKNSADALAAAIAANQLPAPPTV